MYTYETGNVKPWLRVCQPYDFFEFLTGYRRNGKPAALLEEFHFREFWVFPNFLKRIDLPEFSFEPHVDAEPNGFLAGGARFEIFAFGKLGFIRMSLSNDSCHAYDARNLAVGMVKKNPVAIGHFLRHEIAGLVVPNAEPRRPSVFFELVDRIFRRFGFHEPVAHFLGSQKNSP